MSTESGETLRLDPVCPDCGSVEVEANTWEAWCADCDWRVEAPHPAYEVIRARVLLQREVTAQMLAECAERTLLAVKAEVDQAPARLQAAVRTALVMLPAKRVADLLGVTPARVYQLRDGKR